jgi:predicted RNase H-like HicB family nuclease
MQKIIKAKIYFDGEYYCARTFDIDVFTQGKTYDEVVKNLKEAVALHLEPEFQKELLEKLK